MDNCGRLARNIMTALWRRKAVFRRTKNDESDDFTDDKLTSDVNNSYTDDTDNDCHLKPKKKTRTVFSRHQIFYLESAFDTKRYLSSTERAEIAGALNLTETQVKVWFQNRRNKWKSQLSGAEPAIPSERYPGLLLGGQYPLSLPTSPPPLQLFGRPMFFFWYCRLLTQALKCRFWFMCSIDNKLREYNVF